jgi:hypothetical protein
MKGMLRGYARMLKRKGKRRSPELKRESSNSYERGVL